MSFTVRLLPANCAWRGDTPIDLATAAADCDVLLDFPCGGRRLCGRCNVSVTQGGSTAVHVGCQLVLHADATVEIPQTVTSVPLKSFGPLDLLRDGFTPAMTLPAHGDAWGFAVDVGTSTLAAALIELRTGAVAGTVSEANPQIAFGADVMTRIGVARDSSRDGRELHERLVAAIAGMLGALAGRAGVAVDDVYGVAFVGNPTMMHTLRAADVSPLGVAPYEGVLRGAWCGVPADIGLSLPPHVRLYCGPAIASHVGADTVANIIAAGLDTPGPPRLLIDLGTNTEIVLAYGERLVATSASGGPAFEGGCIHQGMRAIPGAIDGVRIDRGRVIVHTIARARPIGICGSGLVDAVAALLREGVIAGEGRMRSRTELLGESKPLLAGRIMMLTEHERAFRLAGPTDDPVVLTAVDVRQLQLVKGSIGAAIALLLERVGCSLADVAEVLVAGAFGNRILKESALSTGVLPAVGAERVRLIGHAAGVGSRMLLVDQAARVRAASAAERAEFLDLAGRADFERHFVAALAYE